MYIIELIKSYPKPGVILIAVALSFLISLINHFVLDKARVKEIKQKQKDIQAEMSAHRKAGNHEKALELNKEMLSYTGEIFKHSLKPMLITMVPILVIFGFIKGIFSETVIAKTWIWYYIGAALVSSMIFRKLFKLP